MSAREVSGAVFCPANFALRGGEIAMQGLFRASSVFGGKTRGVPITGGTGIYRNARGYVTVRVPTNVPNQADAYFVVHLG
jgi:hypothetical protein